MNINSFYVLFCGPFFSIKQKYFLVFDFLFDLLKKGTFDCQMLNSYEPDRCRMTYIYTLIMNCLSEYKWWIYILYIIIILLTDPTCIDKLSNCKLVPQAKIELCDYPFYKTACCRSCKKREHITHVNRTHSWGYM